MAGIAGGLGKKPRALTLIASVSWNAIGGAAGALRENNGNREHDAADSRRRQGRELPPNPLRYQYCYDYRLIFFIAETWGRHGKG